jgi:hypothetical protein
MGAPGAGEAPHAYPRFHQIGEAKNSCCGLRGGDERPGELFSGKPLARLSTNRDLIFSARDERDARVFQINCKA